MNRTEYLAQRAALMTEAEGHLEAGDVEAYNATEAQVTALDAKFEAIAKAQTNMAALKNVTPMPGMEANAAIEAGAVPKIEDRFGTLEYRNAFMNFCQTGVMSSEFQNADAQTTVSEAGAVIPKTIVEEIIKDMKVYGVLFQRVRKTNIKGGVEVPILSLKPTATWITETTPSDRKKVTANTKVSFTYFGLECKVATSLIADIASLDSFETTIKELIAEAMAQAMDIAIIAGSGSGQPTGITVDARVAEGQKITILAADISDWGKWKKQVFAKIPLAYRAGGSFIMAAGTFEGYIDGMVDANGQPIGRVNAGIKDGPQERFGGREVLLVEDDVVAPYDTASTGDVIAVFCKLRDFAINSNMEMRVFRWLDHDTNQWVDKTIMVADGKILDPKGVLIIKKGA